MSQLRPQNSVPREKEIFLRALEIDSPAEREQFLAAECGNDLALRRRLDRLLRADAPSSDLLDPTRFGCLNLARDSLARELAEDRQVIDGLQVAGTQIGDYELIEELGRGTMGVVFRARQLGLDREVAVKVILGSSLASPSDRNRFILEAEAAASLKHPNIVPIYEIGRYDSFDYYSMPLFRGGTLGKQMSGRKTSGRRYTQPEAAQLILTLCRAVQAAHQRGIIHRDLKPDNALLDESGVASISDFGLACRLEQKSTLTLTGQILGTPRYMAPEQAESRSRQPTIAVDIYSLGAMLYELLSGAPPVQGETVLHTLELLKTSQPKRLRSIAPATSRDLETIVHKCLRRNPDDRYASAKDLADELTAWLEGRPIAARPAGRMERLYKLVRRRPVESALTATVTALLLTFGIGGPTIAWQQTRLREEADEARRQAELERKAAVDARTQVERALRLNQSLAYSYSTRLAAAAANSERFSLAAHGILRSWIPTEGQDDLRGWEWYYSFADVYLKPLTIKMSDQPVVTARFSTLGQYFVVSAGDLNGSVIRDGLTSAKVRELPDPTGYHRQIFWTPDDRRITTLSSTGVVKRWDAMQGRELAAIQPAIEPTAVKWITPVWGTDRILCLMTDSSIVEWQVGDTGPAREVRRVAATTDDLERIALSPDGRYLAATGIGREVYVWPADALGGQPTVLSGHAGVVLDLCWHKDSRWLATYGADKAARVWEIPSGARLVQASKFNADVTAITWDPNGFGLLFGIAHEGSLRFLDISTSTMPQVVQLKSKITSLDWNARTHSAIVGMADGSFQLRRIGLPEASRVLWQRGNTPIKSVAWSSDASLISIRRSTGVLLVNAIDGTLRPVTGIPIERASACVWVDSAHQQLTVAVPDGARTRLYDVDQTLQRGTLMPISFDRGLVSMAWGPDQAYLAALLDDGSISTWDPRTGARLKTLRTATPQSDPSATISISADGRLLAATGSNAPLGIWHTDTGDAVNVEATSAGAQAPAQTEAKALTHAWNSKQSLLATGNADGSITIWNCERWTKVRSFSTPSARAPILAWHPDGMRLASGGDDGAIHIWDTASGESPIALTDIATTITGLAWGPDGRRLAEVGADGKLRVWDATAGYLINGDPVPTRE